MLGSLRRIAASAGALALLVLALPGCGDGKSSLPPDLQRLELMPEGAPQQPQETVVASSYRATKAVPDWKYKAQRMFMRYIGKGRAGYHLLSVVDEPGIERRIEFPGPFDPATFNQVAVEVYCPGMDTLQVLPLRHGVVVGGAPPPAKRLPPRQARQTVVFDLPNLRRLEQPLDAIAIVWAGTERRAGIVSIELRHRPWSQWLPKPDAAAGMIDIEGEMRLGKGLSSWSGLRAELEIAPEHVFEFSVGLPPQLQLPRSRPLLRLRVEDAHGRVLERQYSLEGRSTEKGRAGSRWTMQKLALDGLAAGRAVASWKLESARPEEVVCAIAEPRLVRRSRRAPTVVLITSDTHRADYLGLAGRGVAIQTPFLDGLASRGTYFSDCLSSANVTNPSHVALMTGSSPRDTGVIANEKPLPPEGVTLAEHFRDAGYVTHAAVCAVHLTHRQSGLGQGFDRMSAPTDPQQDSQLALEQIESWLADADGLPLFLWWHTFDAHAPYDLREPYVDEYWDGSRDPRDESLPPLPESASVHWLGEVRDLAYVEALYRGEVSYVDAQAKRLLSLPRMQDAWIAFTADHGESLGHHDIYWDHRELYPENLQVPLILCGPGVPEGMRCERAVEQIDVGRTLLDLAGLGQASFPGEDLLQIAADQKPESSVRYALSAHALSASVLAGRWFLVLHLREHSFVPSQPPRKLHEVELYDIERDPTCKQNLAAQEHERAKLLRSQVVQWLLSAQPLQAPSEATAVDQSVIDNLIALGYSGDSSEVSTRWIDPECDCENCLAFRE